MAFYSKAVAFTLGAIIRLPALLKKVSLVSVCVITGHTGIFDSIGVHLAIFAI